MKRIKDQFVLTPADSQILKALAIVAVISLHALSLLPNQGYYTPGIRWFYIGLDQSLRFCVPLFVFLSGHGLARRYLNQTPNWLRFMSQRTKPLILLYIIWSVYLTSIIRFIPGWDQYPFIDQWWTRVFLGQSEYHLYFLPMLLQLYALFPILQRLEHKRLLIVGLISIVGQFSLNYWSGSQGWADQLQYVVSISWLSYFVMGILVARHPQWIRRIPVWLLPLAWVNLVIHAGTILDLSQDLVLAMRSTKISVWLFSLSLIGVIFRYRSLLKSLRWLISIGQQSLLIYLGHTVILRIIGSDIDLAHYLVVISSLVLVSILSLRLSKV